jgi:NAD(P)-dependent dehydrogenase (short-subunit alcohol dehydrogenase family)
LIEKSTERFGGIDVLVLNHIIGMYEDWAARLMRAHASKTIEDDMDFVDKMFAVNSLSYIYLSSYALPALAKSQGRIMAVGSAAGKQGLPRVAPYSATKHSIFGYFDSLRQDLVASSDPSLQSISITTGILGSFDTETARAGTKGYLDQVVTWHQPAKAASALMQATARRLRDVYVPWEQTRIATLLHPLMPTLMDWVIRTFTLSGEL